MKTIKVLIAAALFAGITSLSFAGPGPQFWDQQTRSAKARIAAEAKTDAPKPATQVASCATCSCCAKKT
jgi:hypothetical protein